jgi:hypothetical protein
MEIGYSVNGKHHILQATMSDRPICGNKQPIASIRIGRLQDILEYSSTCVECLRLWYLGEASREHERDAMVTPDARALAFRNA